MNTVVYYTDREGRQPVKDYIDQLSKKTDKDSRIKRNKIRDYIRTLMLHGKMAGFPYVKHIDGEIWELRPLKIRIFFVSWGNNTFVLLHHFQKKTKKTPLLEIQKAKLYYKDMLERSK